MSASNVFWLVLLAVLWVFGGLLLALATFPTWGMSDSSLASGPALVIIWALSYLAVASLLILARRRG